MISNFSFPNRIIFGPGALSQLPDLIAEQKAQKVLLVTDVGLVKAGLADRVLNLLPGAICFDGVEANPTEACMEAATDVLRKNACDLVIGLGGGSAIDTAKAACFRLNHPGPLADFEIQVDGHLKMTNDIPPLIAIPTTAGTGTPSPSAAFALLRTILKRLLKMAITSKQEATCCSPPAWAPLLSKRTWVLPMRSHTHSQPSPMSHMVWPTLLLWQTSTMLPFKLTKQRISVSQAADYFVVGLACAMIRRFDD